MTDTNQKLKVLVAEDHELARYGLTLALEDSGKFKVVAEAQNGSQAILYAQEHQPDIILMDIGMPVMDGIAATRKLKAELPAIKVIVLTSHKEEEEVYAALASGADAYCLKDIKIERLCQVIEMVVEGALWIDPAIARLVLQSIPGNEPPKSTPGQTRKKYNTELTQREMDVLKLIVSGKSNKEIALDLRITAHTAKAHVCSIIQKLAVDDRTQAAVKALQEGLVPSLINNQPQ